MQALDAACHSIGAVATWIVSTLLLTFVFWTCFGACVDTPAPDDTPQARVVAAWDPLSCGDPHRVVVELADDAGAQLSLSTPCTLGALTIDVPHFGTYHARVYAWTLGEPDRSIASLDLAVDVPVVQWAVEMP